VIIGGAQTWGGALSGRGRVTVAGAGDSGAQRRGFRLHRAASIRRGTLELADAHPLGSGSVVFSWTAGSAVLQIDRGGRARGGRDLRQHPLQLRQ